MRCYMPCNRHLLLERYNNENEEDSTTKVLLPDGYKVAKDHGVYRVMGAAADCVQEFRTNSLVIVEEHLVRTLKAEEEYLIIPENGVLMVSE